MSSLAGIESHLAAITGDLGSIAIELQRINHRLHGIEQAIILQGTNIMSALDDLEAVVANETTVTASAMALMKVIKSELDAALAAPQIDTARIAAVSAKIGTDMQALADSVVANTPAAPTQPAPAPTPATP